MDHHPLGGPGGRGAPPPPRGGPTPMEFTAPKVLGPSPGDLQKMIQQRKTPPTSAPAPKISRGTPPPSPGQKPAPKVSKWVIDDGDTSKWKFNSDQQNYPKSLSDPIIWEDCLGFTRSAGGSEGVFFMGWEGNQIIVLKGSSSVFSDEVAYQLGMLAKMPFCPTRIITCAEPDYDKIITQLNLMDQRHPEAIRGRHKALLRVPILQLMEFVAGWDLKHCDPQLVFPPGDQTLIDERAKVMGRIQVFDTFVNNTDRVPTLWRSGGNIANLFYVRGDDSRVIGIDQATKLIPTDVPNYQYYSDCMASMVQDIIEFDPKSAATIQNNKNTVNELRCFLMRCSMRTDIGPSGTVACWVGMMTGIVDIVENINDQILIDLGKKIKQMANLVRLKGQEDWGIGYISIEFLQAMLKIYRGGYPAISKRLKEYQAETSQN